MHRLDEMEADKRARLERGMGKEDFSQMSFLGRAGVEWGRRGRMGLPAGRLAGQAFLGPPAILCKI